MQVAPSTVCLLSLRWLGCHGPAERVVMVLVSAPPCCCPTIKRMLRVSRQGQRIHRGSGGSHFGAMPEGRLLLGILCLRGCSAVDATPFDSARHRHTGWAPALACTCLHLPLPSSLGSTGAFLHHNLCHQTPIPADHQGFLLRLASSFIGSWQPILQASIAPRVSESQGPGPEPASQRRAPAAWAPDTATQPSWVLFSRPF